MASAQACCRACRAKGAATCNVYNFCAEPGGCTYSLGKNRTVSLTPGQCELRYNLAVNMAMGECCHNACWPEAILSSIALWSRLCSGPATPL